MFTQRTLTTKLFGYCVNYGFIYPWTVLCTGPGCFNRRLTLAMIAPNCFSAFTGLCALLTLESVLETSVCKRCHGNQASICKHCPNIHIYIYIRKSAAVLFSSRGARGNQSDSGAGNASTSVTSDNVVRDLVNHPGCRKSNMHNICITWGFPQMGVPQNGRFIMEIRGNSIYKWMINGVAAFMETCIYASCMHVSDCRSWQRSIWSILLLRMVNSCIDMSVSPEPWREWH